MPPANHWLWLPTVSTLIYIWCAAWLLVAVMAGILAHSGHRLVKALERNGERRQTYHIVARKSRLTRVVFLALGLWMLAVGLLQLYGLLVDASVLARAHVGELTLISLSAIAPLIALVLVAEWRVERVLLRDGQARPLWKFWAWTL